MYIKVECICGKILKLNEAKPGKCRCGAVIYIEIENGWYTPNLIARENSLAERRLRGKRVVRDEPAIVEFYDGKEIYLANQLELLNDVQTPD